MRRTESATIVLTRASSSALQVSIADSLGAADSWQFLQDIPALVGTTASVPDPTPIANRTSRFYHALLVP